MSIDVPDAAEQYRSEHYQRTVEIERRIEDGVTADECYDRETDFSLHAAQVTLVPGDRVLDLCCGVGEHADRIRAKTGADIDAFDLSDQSIAKAASREEIRQRTAGVHGKISFALGDMGKILEKVPPAQRYKLVTVLGASFIYLETKEKYKKALTDYFSLLEEGGKLVLQFRPGSPSSRRPKDPVRARDGVVLLSSLARPSKGRGTFLKDGEEYELMQDMAQGDGCYYYMPNGYDPTPESLFIIFYR